jgi:hypothetical protein
LGVSSLEESLRPSDWKTAGGVKHLKRQAMRTGSENDLVDIRVERQDILLIGSIVAEVDGQLGSFEAHSNGGGIDVPRDEVA